MEIVTHNHAMDIDKPVSTEIIDLQVQPNATTSSHHMITRSKNDVFKPKIYLSTSKEAIQIEENGMDQEIAALVKNNTWKSVDLPCDRRAIGSKWIFKLKDNPDGTIMRHKARLVFHGFNQVAGVDYSQTFSLIAKLATIRVVLSIAVQKSWVVHQMDVSNPFLNGDLKEEVYMKQPFGFEDQQTPGDVCKLIKSLYGLKHAPRAWFEKHTMFTQLKDLHQLDPINLCSLYVQLH